MKIHDKAAFDEQNVFGQGHGQHRLCPVFYRQFLSRIL